MINISKQDSEVGTKDIILEIKPKVYLYIIFGGNGDIYWIYNNFNMLTTIEDPMHASFTITKDNTDIYDIFDELYEDLIHCHIFLPEKTFFISHEEEIATYERSNQLERQSRRYNDLVQNNIITWYSDEEMKETADSVRISKKEDTIFIEFIRQTLINDMNMPRDPYHYSIRIRMDGSRYTPCDIVFWRHFNNLQKYVPSEKQYTKLKRKNQ